jgi:serine/threonine protein kinase
MGNCSSTSHTVVEDSDVFDTTTSVTEFASGSLWKQPLNIEETRDKYRRLLALSNDTSALQFRALLDDDMACRHFFSYAKSAGHLALVRAWKDLQAQKFLIASMDDSESSECVKNPDLPEPPTSPKRLILPLSVYTTLFDDVSEEDKRTPVSEIDQICFNKLYDVYKHFIGTSAFDIMCRELRVEYNAVNADCFEYFEKLSEGAYGFIVHVRKKSTGQHFAMKLQHKALLLRHYKKETHRVVQEMQAIACCNHPFIVGLHYAFQTETLAIMTMPLCVYGDLGLLIMNSPNKRIPFAHVVFYAAEVVSALGYLHKNGIIYRDLKPANILLHGSGHILLADFGAVADAEGIISGSIAASRGRSNTVPPSNTIGFSGKCVASFDSSDQHVPLFRMYSSLGENTASSFSGTSVNTSFRQTGGSSYKTNSSFFKNSSSKYEVRDGGSDDLASSPSSSMSGGAGGIYKSGSASASGKTGLSGISLGIMSSEAAGEGGPMHEFRATEVIPEEDQDPEDRDYRTRDRAKSIVGTVAYMAPEILLKFGSKEYLDMTYTRAVDYWSLGVSVYALIFGKLPFRRVQLDAVQTRLTEQLRHEEADPFSIFQGLFGRAHYYALDEFIVDGYGQQYNYSIPVLRTSADAQKVEERAEVVESFIESLLRFAPSERAGMESSEDFSELNLHKIKNHPFFVGIDWNLLEQKAVRPPPIPQEVLDLSSHTFSYRFDNPNVQGTTLNYLLVKYGREKWLRNGDSHKISSVDATPALSPSNTVVFKPALSTPPGSDKARVSPIPSPEQPSKMLEALGLDPAAANSPCMPSQSSKKDKYRVFDRDQLLFNDWYYVSPAAIDKEFSCQVRKGHEHLFKSSSSKRKVET